MTTYTFIGFIPEVSSAIKIGKDGMRVMFDVPESELKSALGLIDMRGKALTISVEEMPFETDGKRVPEDDDV